MLHDKISKLNLAGIVFPVQFQFPMTGFRYFRDFCISDGKVDHPEILYIPREEILRQKGAYGNETFTEYNLFLKLICNKFLIYDRCLFHGVALCINGQAWMISAPSGTGKSTQYRLLKDLFGEKIQLICGDKPILEFRPSGDIIVHSSPWMGKERWQGSGCARLAGIVYLEQGQENVIGRMPISEALVPLYCQFLYLPEKEGELRTAASMLDRILRQIPVWKLVNRGDEASARLLYHTICKERINQ